MHIRILLIFAVLLSLVSLVLLAWPSEEVRSGPRPLLAISKEQTINPAPQRIEGDAETTRSIAALLFAVRMSGWQGKLIKATHFADGLQWQEKLLLTDRELFLSLAGDLGVEMKRDGEFVAPTGPFQLSGFYPGEVLVAKKRPSLDALQILAIATAVFSLFFLFSFMGATEREAKWMFSIGSLTLSLAAICPFFWLAGASLLPAWIMLLSSVLSVASFALLIGKEDSEN